MAKIYAQRAGVCLIAGLALALPGLAEGRSINNYGLPAIDLNFVNFYKIPNRDAYVYIKGQVQQRTCGQAGCLEQGQFVYVTNRVGDVALTPTIGQGEYRALPKAPAPGLKDGLGIYEGDGYALPQLAGMRIYISIDRPVKVCCNPQIGGSPSDPDGWVNNRPGSGRYNYETIFDFLEPTWVPASPGKKGAPRHQHHPGRHVRATFETGGGGRKDRDRHGQWLHERPYDTEECLYEAW